MPQRPVVETVLLACVDDLPAAVVGPWTARRTLGVNGTRIAAVVGDTTVGHIEVDTILGDAARLSRWGNWADVGNLWVEPAHRRHGIGTWLMGQASAWLRLAGVTRLLDYTTSGEDTSFLRAVGFTELTRTEREMSMAPADLPL